MSFMIKTTSCLEAVCGSQICRICLEVNKNKDFVNSIMINSHYSTVTDVQVNESDDLPEWLCCKCANLLEKFVFFRQRCRRANGILKHIVAKLKKNPQTVKLNTIEHYRKELMRNAFEEGIITIHSGVQSMRNGANEILEPPPCFLSLGFTIIDEDRTPVDDFSDYDGEAFDCNANSDDSDLPLFRLKQNTVDPFLPKLVDEWKMPAMNETATYTVVQLTREEVVQEMDDRRASLVAPFSCLACAKAFLTEDTYQEHMGRHNKICSTDVECEFCHQHLSSRILLRKHMKSHIVRYKCKVCNAMRSSARSVNEHHSRTHAGTSNFICHFCQKAFTRRNMLVRHMECHTLKVSKMPCEKCGKLFSHQNTLRMHIVAMHTDTVPVYKCDQCPKEFRMRSSLLSHKYSHRKTKDFYCVECDLSFKTSQQLKVHLTLTARHVRPDAFKYACSHCDKKFTTNPKLTEHVMWEHQKKYRHRCVICDKNYRTAGGLRMHNKTVHIRDSIDYKHKCEHCQKAFITQQLLKAHIRTHTGERPFTCDQCGRSFSQKASMQTHVKLVHLKIKRNVRKKPISKTQNGLMDYNTAVPILVTHSNDTKPTITMDDGENKTHILY